MLPRCLLPLLATVLLGGDEQATEDQRRLDVIEQTAKAYTLYDPAAADQPLARSQQPLLKFEDPVTKAAKGAVYVWSDGGKQPLAIASIYFRGDGARVDEFQSLAAGKLVAQQQGAIVWQPARPGLTWTTLPGDVPDRGPRRLAKMRDLARQFAAAVSDAQSGRQELRLLPQPIYRYDNADRGIVDGGLFCYAKGTNPEVLLLLQAEKEEGRTEWKHAFCRMTERECEVKADGRVVWTVAKAPIPQAPEDPYFNRTIQ